MRPLRSTTMAFGVAFVLVALGPPAASAQTGVPGIAGGGSVAQYVGDDGPAAGASISNFDSFLLHRFAQARSVAARWFAASRPAGARATLSARPQRRTR